MTNIHDERIEYEGLLDQYSTKIGQISDILDTKVGERAVGLEGVRNIVSRKMLGIGDVIDINNVDLYTEKVGEPHFENIITDRKIKRSFLNQSINVPYASEYAFFPDGENYIGFIKKTSTLIIFDKNFKCLNIIENSTELFDFCKDSHYLTYYFNLSGGGLTASNGCYYIGVYSSNYKCGGILKVSKEGELMGSYTGLSRMPRSIYEMGEYICVIGRSSSGDEPIFSVLDFNLNPKNSVSIVTEFSYPLIFNDKFKYLNVSKNSAGDSTGTLNIYDFKTNLNTTINFKIQTSVYMINSYSIVEEYLWLMVQLYSN